MNFRIIIAFSAQVIVVLLALGMGILGITLDVYDGIVIAVVISMSFVTGYFVGRQDENARVGKTLARLDLLLDKIEERFNKL